MPSEHCGAPVRLITDEYRRNLSSEKLNGRRAKEARRAVSIELARYHQSLVDAFSADAASFFERIMEQAERDIQAGREQRTSSSADERERRAKKSLSRNRWYNASKVSFNSPLMSPLRPSERKAQSRPTRSPL
jgi:hypothetical protein